MSTVSAGQDIQQAGASTQQRDVVVIGAGPYGLSTAAHLAAKGLNVAIFGKPMEAWREKMPAGMFLRSHWWASNLSDPQEKYSLKQFFAVSPYNICYPVPIQLFIDYGMWFQKQAVPFVDPTYVSSLEKQGNQFVLTLEDGRVVVSATVVLAVGPMYYPRIPAEYTHIPAELISHSSAYEGFDRFAGKRVAIIGGGQSSIEWSALLNEAGASVDLIARRPIIWLETHGEAKRSLIQRIIAPDAGVSPGWKFKGIEVFPYLFHRFPVKTKDRMVYNTHQPAGSNWLEKRVIGKVTIHDGQKVREMNARDGKVDIVLSDTTSLSVDHVILATGYQADVSHIPFLSPALVKAIETHLGSPVLNTWFESTVPGLYFTGFSTLQGFGPLFRFVAGTKATAPRITRAVARYTRKMR